jgi:hypothetical protein
LGRQCKSGMGFCFGFALGESWACREKNPFERERWKAQKGAGLIAKGVGVEVDRSGQRSPTNVTHSTERLDVGASWLI